MLTRSSDYGATAAQTGNFSVVVLFARVARQKSGVLVVDDNPDTVRGLAKLLTLLGFDHHLVKPLDHDALMSLFAIPS